MGETSIEASTSCVFPTRWAISLKGGGVGDALTLIVMRPPLGVYWVEAKGEWVKNALPPQNTCLGAVQEEIEADLCQTTRVGDDDGRPVKMNRVVNDQAEVNPFPTAFTERRRRGRLAAAGEEWEARALTVRTSAPPRSF